MDSRAGGGDIHRKFNKVRLMDISADGEIGAIKRARLNRDDREAMRRWLSRLAPEVPAALEAAFGWPWVAILLKELATRCFGGGQRNAEWHGAGERRRAAKSGNEIGRSCQAGFREFN